MGIEDKIKEFIDYIPPEKLKGWRDREYTIYSDRKLGFRIDHQGLNKDKKTKPHRIYIQSCKGGKAITSEGSSKNTLASVHCDDPPTSEQELRDKLFESYKTKKPNVIV